MGDCVPTPTATQFATEVDTTTLQTTTLFSESTVVAVQTGSFPSTICPGSNGSGCSVLIITYRISSTSTTLVPTATSTVISQVTNIHPQQTFFAPCTITDHSTPSNNVSTPSNNVSAITLPYGGVSVTSAHVPSGYTQDNSGDSSNTNHSATIGSVIAVVVTLSLSVIGFFMWTLWKKNRAMKAALEGRPPKEDDVNQFLPTPYLVTYPPPGPSSTYTSSSPTPQLTPRIPLSNDHSSAHTRQQNFVPSLSVSPMHSTSPSTGHESDAATSTHSVHSSPSGSQTHFIVPSQLPGPSGIAGGHQQISAGARAKGREARLERTISDRQLPAVNITEGGDSEYPPSGPPPAYSKVAR